MFMQIFLVYIHFCSCWFDHQSPNESLHYSLSHTQGFLGSIYTMTEKLHTCVLAIFTVAVTILGFNVQRSKENIPIAIIFMSGNILGILISGFVLSPTASFWRDSESIDQHCVQHRLFPWLLLAGSVYYYEEAWFGLVLVVSPPVWVAWTLQIIPGLMVIGGTWFICMKWPKVCYTWWIPSFNNS